MARRPAVDVALVLAIDCSGSVSEGRLSLQRDGYTQAFRSPALVRAVAGGAQGRIAVTFVGWTDAGRHEQVVDWMLVSDATSAHRFADAIAKAVLPTPGWTSISSALAFGTALLLESGFRPARRVIDISSDGVSNDGPPVTRARDAAIAAGVTINGLPIVEIDHNLAAYYRAEVIGGPNAFVEIAHRASDFGIAMLRKLVLEVADR